MIRLVAHSIIACTLINMGVWAAVGGWKFSWSDEFSGPTVDAAVWGFENGYVRNSEAQYYTNRIENSRIDNGTLLIQALQDNWNGYPITAASRTTRGKKTFLYGRFEMRAQIDIRSGSWPAWWWVANSGGWPKGGEIDMMEFYQSKCLFNVMDGSGNWTSPTRSIASLGGDRWATFFHVWTFDWDSTKIDLYLDSMLINHYPLSNADGTGPGGGNPFRFPGIMIINQAIGGINGGSYASTAFPVNYRIDYIRQYAWSAAETAYSLTVQSGAGSGTYVVATNATIVANMPPAGQVFDKWIIVSGDATIDTLTSPSALLTMPSSDVTVKATYKTGNTALIRPFLSAKTDPVAGHEPLSLYDIRGRKMAAFGGGNKMASRAGVYIACRKNFLSRELVVLK